MTGLNPIKNTQVQVGSPKVVDDLADNPVCILPAGGKMYLLCNEYVILFSKVLRRSGRRKMRDYQLRHVLTRTHCVSFGFSKASVFKIYWLKMDIIN